MDGRGTWGDRDEAPRLFFERLVDDDHHEPRDPVPRRTHDAAALRESVRSELERLLGARCPLPSAAVGRERSIWDYGLTDLTEGGRRSVVTDAAHMEGVIARTIRAFEPRLREVSVRVGKEPAPGGRVPITIEGALATTRVRVPVAFHFEADVRAAAVSTDEHARDD